MEQQPGKMENLGIKDLFSGIYNGKKVLVTGHTGFKGSWLCYWLQQMGAEVSGFSLAPDGEFNHYQLLNLNTHSTIADINDLSAIKSAVSTYQPEMVFHLAAQPLVRLSYETPLNTLSTNIMGTAHLLEACKGCDFVKAIVVITSDKCYENNEWLWGYRENDPMGGFDPYSVSKGCAELVVSSYRRSFFNLHNYKKTHQTLIATARAGNVIGGGDWSADRLIPDIVRATVSYKKTIIRNPNSTRPWQHVLEPLSGYLLLGQQLLEGKTECAEAFNFGPGDEGAVNVFDIISNSKAFWNAIDFEIDNTTEHPHEANYLKLDCSKAHHQLQWKGVWNVPMTLEKTIHWYKEFHQQNRINTEQDLSRYIQDAKANQLIWTK